MHTSQNTSEDCLFCRIARGEVPSHPVHEGERIFAFLDINPIRPGHTQIIPRDHHRYFDELPPDLAAEIVHLGQRLATLLKQTTGVKRVAFLFTGGDVPHAHAHVVPLVSPVDITSRRYIAEPKLTWQSTPRVPDEELAVKAQLLREGLAQR
jgi:histidine triad (HIT) family protein